jgi:glycerol-3-phosphate dehydrogenase (NAD(P)+)
MRIITVLGAGSWGTALAVHLGRLEHTVRLWARDDGLAGEMRTRRANTFYLPDVILPPAVHPTGNLPDALDGTSLVIVAVPSHGVRGLVQRAAPLLAPGAVLVSAAKGLEEATLLRMSEVVAETLGPDHPVAVLSGPSFAAEVARGLPAAVLVGSPDARAREVVQHELRGRSLRLYATDDVVGVEIGGATKNVIAIAAGVVDALGLGQNALAALITRGLTEISRLACALGGRRETLAGLSGLGDLVLTCTGSLSRNRRADVPRRARARRATRCRDAHHGQDGRGDGRAQGPAGGGRGADAAAAESGDRLGLNALRPRSVPSARLRGPS